MPDHPHCWHLRDRLDMEWGWVEWWECCVVECEEWSYDKPCGDFGTQSST